MHYNITCTHCNERFTNRNHKYIINGNYEISQATKLANTETYFVLLASIRVLLFGKFATYRNFKLRRNWLTCIAQVSFPQSVRLPKKHLLKFVVEDQFACFIFTSPSVIMEAERL